MTLRTLSYQTFAEIARETAKKRHGESWRVYSDDILSSLLHDFWCGHFTDGQGESRTFDLSHRQGGNYQSITREVVWRTLGFNKPRIVSNFWGENPPPWDFLATAKIEDYGSGARALFENLALSEADARAWMGQYDKENLPPRVGRPTLMPEIKEEMRRRARKGKLSHSMYEESRRLRGWAEERYSDRLAHIPTKETIETKLGPIYRELRARLAS